MASSKESFVQVVGIFALGFRYDIPYLRRRAISELTLYCPSTLQSWDDPKRKRLGSSECVRLIVLAKTHGVLVFLPTAFYSVCALNTPQQIVGVGLADTDKAVCIEASRRLLRAKRERLYGFLWSSVSAGCQNPVLCRGQKLSMARRLSDEADCELLDLNIDWSRSRLCVPCLASAKITFNLSRQQLWDDLPSFFDLRNWTSLQTLSITDPDQQVHTAPASVAPSSRIGVQKCNQLWFEDGSIILQAETTQFRVYRAVLQAQSRLLHSEFSLENVNLRSGEEVEGCPLVHLSESSVDVEHFLKVLHDTRSVYLFYLREEILMNSPGFTMPYCQRMQSFP